jgi:hypothetical protein
MRMKGNRGEKGAVGNLACAEFRRSVKLQERDNGCVTEEENTTVHRTLSRLKPIQLVSICISQQYLCNRMRFLFSLSLSRSETVLHRQTGVQFPSRPYD